jgi:hypothetical protein
VQSCAAVRTAAQLRRQAHIMAFNELEHAKLHKVVAAFVEAIRPPPHIRPELDLGFRILGQSVEIFEIRPKWRGEPGQMLEHSVAKAAFVKSTGTWRVYWQRADLKWHAYQPAPQVGTIELFLGLVSEDKHACFFG